MECNQSVWHVKASSTRLLYVIVWGEVNQIEMYVNAIMNDYVAVSFATISSKRKNRT